MHEKLIHHLRDSRADFFTRIFSDKTGTGGIPQWTWLPVIFRLSSSLVGEIRLITNPASVYCALIATIGITSLQ